MVHSSSVWRGSLFAFSVSGMIAWLLVFVSSTAISLNNE